jgi:hypothetical protein
MHTCSVERAVCESCLEIGTGSTRIIWGEFSSFKATSNGNHGCVYTFRPFIWLVMVTWYWKESFISKECKSANIITLSRVHAILRVPLHSMFLVTPILQKILENYYSFLIKCSWKAIAYFGIIQKFHLSPHENIFTIALIKIHYLYTIRDQL